MNYPLWIMPNLDVGALVAMIAIPHVYISHLAVGGGLFLVLTETLAYRRNNMPLLDYVRRHTWFFLLLTMVFGGISGVGIWFIIALAQPAATSKLIHNFVFGWATEWVFFIVEITALLIYHYLFTKLKPRPHLIIGWIYFAAAWLSMVIIHGILSFMLTPGRWVETHNFWDGFFNPGYWPGLLFRTSMALTIAGLFGLVTAVRTKDNQLRLFLARYCAIWVSLPFVVMLLAGKWYWAASNRELGGQMLKRFYFMGGYEDFLIWGSVIIFIGGVLMLIRQPRAINVALVTALVIIGFCWMGSFEFLRENARRPWVITGYMYSNSVLARDVERLDKEGWGANAVWVRDDTPEHEGQDILTHQCLVCHTIGGRRELMQRTERFDQFSMTAQLTGMGKVQAYMPMFVGTEDEKALLAKYIVEELHGKQPTERQPVEIEPSGVEVTHEFNAAPATTEEGPPPSEYVVLCWNDTGMSTLADADGSWRMLSPGNTLWAQVIRRGNPPQLVTDGVDVTYRIDPAMDTADPGLAGEFVADADKKAFVAKSIPVTPYRADGKFNPYPMFDIEVHGASGTLLSGTKAAVPVSTEMGCKNCHGGEWSHGVAGVSTETADAILATHDQLSGTHLLSEAKAGKPSECQDCHADPASGAEGDPRRLNLSAAIHGFHANYMSNLGAEACAKCHPADPDGATRCFRGLHSVSVACIDCHGTMSDHALSLLKAEQSAGKPGAEHLMRNLEPVLVDSVELVRERTPWVNEPDCLNCHVDYELSSFESFNHWTSGFDSLFRQRVDWNGVMCAACHGSPHAIRPTENAYGEAVDNYQSLQYLGRTGTIGGRPATVDGARSCTTCHTVEPAVGMHHLKMRR